MDFPTWVPAGVVVTFLGLVGNFVREWRKEKASKPVTDATGRVAEATVQSQVDLSSATAYEARLTAVTKTWDAERASLQRQLDAANTRADDAETREARKHAELLAVRDEMDQLRADFEALQDQLHVATRRVAQLLAEDDAHHDHQERR